MKAQEVLRERIRQRLRELQLTPAALNRLLKRSKTWAYGYLDGKYDLPVDQLNAVATGLQVSVPSLFDESLLGKETASFTARQGDNAEAQTNPTRTPHLRPGESGVSDEHLEYLAAVYTVFAADLDDPARRDLVRIMKAAAVSFAEEKHRKETTRKASGE